MKYPAPTFGYVTVANLLEKHPKYGGLVASDFCRKNDDTKNLSSPVLLETDVDSSSLPAVQRPSEIKETKKTAKRVYCDEQVTERLKTSPMASAGALLPLSTARLHRK